MNIQLPLVSVCILTYNHKDFIAQCLDSVLEQETDFDYEIIIGEDKSPDGTRRICEEYAKKYPDRIQILSGDNNLGLHENLKRVYKACKGKYIAFCEGDDFWIDKLKLKKHVDFLEKNPHYSMVFTNISEVLDGEKHLETFRGGFKRIEENRTYTDIEILDDWIVPTPTILFRSSVLDGKFYKIISDKRFIFTDIVSFLYITTKGEIYGTTDYTATYRRHAGGLSNEKRDIAFDKGYYMHLKNIIDTFGTHLATPKIKRALSRLALSIGLNELSKKHFVKGFRLLMASRNFDKMALSKYLKSKF